MADEGSGCVKLKRREIPGSPWLPVPEDEHSQMVRESVLCQEYPPLMHRHAWRKALPYKDAFEYFKPTETIGCSFSPGSCLMRISDLPPRKKPLPPTGVLDDQGRLQYPPPGALDKDVDIRMVRKRQAAERNQPGVVTLLDLLNGEHDRKKKKAKMEDLKGIRQKAFEDRKRKLEKIRFDEMRLLDEMQGDDPIDIDTQRLYLCNRIQEEQLDAKVVSPQDAERIQYYLNQIDTEMLQPFHEDWLNQARKQVTPQARQLYGDTMDRVEEEVRDDYYLTMRMAIMDYILMDATERERLSIENFPIGFPAMVLRAPHVWSARVTVNSQRLSYSLFIGHPVLLAIREIFKDYKEMIIVPKSALLDLIPMSPEDFNQLTDDLCQAARNKITNEWLIRVSEAVLTMRNTWFNLAPKKPQDSMKLVEGFFACIRSLIEKQFRYVATKSIDHYNSIISHYKDGNDLSETEYRDLLFARIPLLTVIVDPLVGTREVKLVPPLRNIKNLVMSVCSKILHVFRDIPVIEEKLISEFSKNCVSFRTVHSYEPQIRKLIMEVQDYFEDNTPGPEQYLHMYQKYMYILDGEAEKALMEFFDIDPFPFLRDFARKIKAYEAIKDEILFLRRNIPLNLINLDCSKLNHTLWEIIDSLRSYIVDYFINVNREHNKAIAKTFEDMAERANELPTNTAELVALYYFIVESRDATMFNLKTLLLKTAEYVLFLMDHAILGEEDIHMIARVFLWPKDMDGILDSSMQRITLQRDIIESSLRSKRANFDNVLAEHFKLLEVFKKKDPPILTMEEMESNVKEIEVLTELLAQDKEIADAINNEENLLEFEPSPFLLLQQMLTQVEPFDKLWHTCYNFHQLYEKWYSGPFMGLDAEEIKETVENMWRTLYKLSRTFMDVLGSKRVAELVRGKIDKFKQYIPVLEAICNPGLRERHWKLISEALGVELHPTEESCLADMIELGLIRIIPRLEEISTSASREFTLEKNLTKMKSEWVDVFFELVTFRETGVSILSAVDDIQVMLDDHILKAQTMRGSPYVKPFEQEMQDWEEKLVSMQDIIDAWLQVQVTWMYLESIFSSEDIMRQMPDEARNFKQVDTTWREIMYATEQDTQVLRATDYPNLLNILKDLNSLLEDIQKGLNDYLEKKRLFFPRFFFLSNDELLEILSETKDPLRVQPHLKKCFEGIAKLQFTDQVEITGMISDEGEIVPYITTIVPAEAKGLVEKWLIQVESVMRSSLKDICKEAITAYTTEPREVWVLTWPGMVVICGSSVNWTAEVSKAIEARRLTDYLRKSDSQIEDMVKLVRSKLSPGNRVTICALIVMDVHGRDVVKLLRECKVASTVDFNWISQLRYYVRESLVRVCMITTDLAYGYEYLGNTGRLVITPLTDRCYRTLMGALRLNLGGAPEGPAGTGKTETSKDLAKAVAKQCVVFNCSDGLDYKAMGKFFKGLAQAGAWACFDEFNRIELEVLSVIAQQVLSIQMAIIQNKKTFVFEGTEISLDPTCTVFITMNPGYAGRQELPDNLKVLFRTVAMMVPDYAMIGEISLYSMGFDIARSLAEKIVDTYKLCSEQLSSQAHYDYGMRAVKTVLTAAGNLKLKYPDQDEAVIVLRAIVDVNLPKFLAQDLPLFEGIYKDLFPGVDLPSPDRDELFDALRVKLKARNLQATDWYLEKILQVYEMILVRHGLMIVGEPMGGKTCAYQSLAEALSDIAMNRKSTMGEFKVQYRIINPKAITMGQLYGCFDVVSHEWSDGVLANTFREFAVSPLPDRKWLMFDGPVDAVWIENMNTVLDDNKKLCLMSGEIIQMTNKMNMVFEPADLEQASPATVSRCGMIYLEPKMLGWQPIKMSYYTTLQTKLLPEQFELLSELIDWLVPAVFHFVFFRSKMFVETSEIHLFYSFSRLFSCLLDQGEGRTGIGTQILQCLFLFSIVWGLGSVMTGESRIEFDEFYRKMLYGQSEEYPKPAVFKLTRHQLFPDKLTVWDYYFDRSSQGGWITWVDTLERAPLPPNAKVGELIVQTDDMARQQFFLKTFMHFNIPVLFVGPTGTGKSAIVLDHLMGLPREKYLPNVINFSARTSANQTQEIIMSKLDRRRKGVYGPAMGKTCLLFVDDVSMPQKETWGAQPPIELLRQWIDHKHWYDLKNTTRLDLVDILFIGAMLPPGGSSNLVTFRFTRHMNMIGIDSFREATLSKIFTAILDWHFAKGFVENIARMSKQMVAATMQVYYEAMSKFLPTPAKSHYTFNLRDFARVIRGLLLCPASKVPTPEKLFRLWVHETFRVFGDRLVADEDRATLFEVVETACYFHIRAHLDDFLVDLIPEDEKKLEVEHLRSLFYGNYYDPDAEPKIYDEIPDLVILEERMNYYLNEYNLLSRVPMSLVMFKFAIEHVSRISRVLLQDNGHALLVGIGGSGRQSCTKLAASMSEYSLFQIEIIRNYGMNEWRDDLKVLLMSAGIEAKPQVFLFADSQIKDEGFVEDINMILNTGDVPNLFQGEEKAEILEKMTAAARDNPKKIDTTPLALFNFFVDRVRANLHVALAMSPIGDAFRIRLRMFPSLINCCTIDWFMAWPEDALEKVAEKFLQKLDISDEMKGLCVVMCKDFHTSVFAASERYYEALKRKNYVTPTSYLELIMTLQNLYQKKVEQITMMRNRYEVGLEKLDFAAGQVSVMQDELHALQPQLVQTSEATDRLMVKIEQDTVVVEAQKEIVGADEALANEAAAASQAIKDDCESDLAEAIPALEAAIDALNTLKPSDITIVKSMKNPPYVVKLVMEAVCVMKGIRPERKPDPSGSGKMVEDYWAPSQKMLGDMKFLDSLKAYDKDNITPPIMKKIRDRYINDRDFDPNTVKNVSTACEGLCKWVRAMEVYDRVIKIVAPKKAKLYEAEGELAFQMAKLNEKRAQLQAVTDKLQALNDEFAAKTKEKKELEDAILLCEKKLDRAEKLIGGLGGEKSRWSETAKNLQSDLDNAIGDVLLSSGVVAYLGAFTVDFRNELIRQWNQTCFQLGIPCSKNFSMTITLGEPVKIRAWNIHGLPVDTFSVENGIIVYSARRWPLMIDPQGQANKWVKSMEKENRLSVIKLTDSNYMRTVERAIEYGLPIILENILEEIDATLEPVLLKNFYRQGGINYLKVGENLLEYNADFRFYITTRLRNPHYLPEVAVKVTLLNFMITPQGLQDQLLGIVVAQEKPNLEEKKNELIIESANNKRQLKEIEDKILEILSSSEGNILEDETAIQVLSSSKILSEEIQKKQKISAVTEKEIDTARNQYVPVSGHSAVLFFCISELGNIDPMYQYSLVWFINLYYHAIEHSEKSEVLEKRLDNLNSYFTFSIYRNVCRSLFEKDKLTFSFVLCIGIQRAHGAVNEELFTFLLTGGVALDNPFANPDASWLTDKSWSETVRASHLPGLKMLRSSVEGAPGAWKSYYDSFNPHEVPPPAPFGTSKKDLGWLVILRCIRPDKLVPAVQMFIVERMEQKYIEPPPFNLRDSYNDSNCCSPLVFILSAGADPMADLFKFSDDMGMSRANVLTISLGQGQGPIAAKMIDAGILTGQWVVLQNCHLAESWMKQLDKICDEVIIPSRTHPKFRIWLTSYPCKVFPVSILQNGVKMTNEAPKGLRANLYRSFTSDPISDPKFFMDCKFVEEWQKLLFSLCFFHGVVQERRKFGPLGWNIPYEFNESDLRISIRQLQMFLNEYDEIPFEALVYLTGECNYGGRVTDDKDRRLLNSLLSTFYNKNVLHQPGYKFSPSGLYYIPSKTDYDGILDYVGKLPLSPMPEVFGLHENADITKDNKETQNLLDSVLMTQTQIMAGAGGQDMEAMITELSSDILGKLPALFDVYEVEKKYPTEYMQSMNTVLRQELIRYNRLTAVIRKTLVDVVKAVKGLVVMSSDLEEVHMSMLVGRLPGVWAAKSYPSLKPLGSYITDLLHRLKFLQDWIDTGIPVVFWISGFYFTQSFLSGVLQNCARRNKISIDQLGFQFEVTKFESHSKKPPTFGVFCKQKYAEEELGVFVEGMYLEGARWNRQTMMLDESLPKILFDTIPIIWFKPGVKANFKPQSVYLCPLYKTTARRGVLSTTGHSTNFVMYLEFTTDSAEKHWIDRGVASLCQLDD